jgi:hypothetical protein
MAFCKDIISALWASRYDLLSRVALGEGLTYIAFPKYPWLAGRLNSKNIQAKQKFYP